MLWWILSSGVTLSVTIRVIVWWIRECLVQALLWGWGHQAAEAARQSHAFVEPLSRTVMYGWASGVNLQHLPGWNKCDSRIRHICRELRQTQASNFCYKIARSHFHCFSIEICFPSSCIREAFLLFSDSFWFVISCHFLSPVICHFLSQLTSFSFRGWSRCRRGTVERMTTSASTRPGHDLTRGHSQPRIVT